jgi:hypothetical protein
LAAKHFPPTTRWKQFGLTLAVPSRRIVALFS